MDSVRYALSATTEVPFSNLTVDPARPFHVGPRPRTDVFPWQLVQPARIAIALPRSAGVAAREPPPDAQAPATVALATTATANQVLSRVTRPT